MIRHYRSRRWCAAVAAATWAAALAGCNVNGPNSTLIPHSEVGRDIDRLFNILFVGGVVVLILVLAGLLYTVTRFRYREGSPPPRPIYGSVPLEIAWTLIPAVVLAFIAVPTVRTIFRTQATAVRGALQVEVFGHQWWWEFRYPQYGVVTANELYLPAGRTVNFALKTQDVLHSFWLPAIAGKRDLISNHTNYIWYTPDASTAPGAWNGFCVEYCGASHSLMRFKAFTVSPADFEAWIAHQRSGPAFAAAPTAPAAATAAADSAAGALAGTPAGTTAAARPAGAPADTAPAAQTGGGAQATSVAMATFPRERLPRHVIPGSPLPDGLTFANVTGDAGRGAQLYRSSACVACHAITGVSPGVAGPNLTHVGSRTTIASGIYPNDVRHLTRWIKNAPLMKPGSLMPVMGQGQKDPTGKPPMGALTDQQIADIAAYLLALK